MDQKSVFRYTRGLPHLRVSGATYFVTWRLHREQRLPNPDERTLVRDAILKFSGTRYDAVAGVIMGNHVHVIVNPSTGYALETILHTWKSFTANRLKRLYARVGSVWQEEYWDRLIGDETELEEKIGYIRGNPWKRWPDIQEYPWLWPQDVS